MCGKEKGSEKMSIFKAYDIRGIYGAELTQDNFDNLTAIIDDCLNNPKFAENRQSARDETWADYGHGAEAVADYLINKYNELKEKEEKK